MENFSQEIKIIEKICYSFDYETIDSRKIKNLLKDAVSNALSSLGYNFVYNKKLIFRRFDEKNQTLKKKSKGTMDMLFFREKSQIAVEVNRSSVVRLKSVMKLICSDSQLKIAVIYPGKSGVVRDEEIIRRISTVKKAVNMTSPITVINLSEKKTYNV
ncbi:hypothetical protein GF327_02845 [Candidatus Woesearchaeota archaeon]|nr:hypothetical protein [Candidatus Woesearchaeota archaeon]